MIFIPGSVPSSKNSRILTRSGLFIASKATQLWRKDTGLIWSKERKTFNIECTGKLFPLFVGMHFVRKTKHKYDFVNPVQTIQDEMVHHKWIEDDNTGILYPLPLKINGEYSSYDPKNPGVYIHVYSSPEECNTNFII